MKHKVDNITATLCLFLKRSVFEVYAMGLNDVIYTYLTILIDNYNANEQMKAKSK